MSQSQQDAMSSTLPGSSPVPLVAIHRNLATIRSNFLTPKRFLEAYLLVKDKDPIIVRAQNAWSSTSNLESTRRALCTIRDTIIKTKRGRVFWNQWISSERTCSSDGDMLRRSHTKLILIDVHSYECLTSTHTHV